MATQDSRVAEVRGVHDAGDSTKAIVPSRLVEQLELEHGDKVLWDYDPNDNEIRVTPLE